MPENIYGTWVKCKITYKDGSALPDANLLNYAYIKYHFAYPDKVNYSAVYDEFGKEMNFDLHNNILQLKSLEGGLLNSLLIEGFHKDTLILFQSGRRGVDDPTGLKFYLVPETNYQKSLTLNPINIRSINKTDTIYKSCPKIYAGYNGESFSNYIFRNMDRYHIMEGKGGRFVASFIVSKSGLADSLKILAGLGEKYNKGFAKLFKQAGNDWKPAVLNGKPVAVQMMVEVRYLTYMGNEVPEMEVAQEATNYYNLKDYDSALYFYDQALEMRPEDLNALYRRGMCKMLLGNLAGACEDWNKLKALGGANADVMLAKYCK